MLFPYLFHHCAAAVSKSSLSQKAYNLQIAGILWGKDARKAGPCCIVQLVKNSLTPTNNCEKKNLKYLLISQKHVHTLSYSLFHWQYVKKGLNSWFKKIERHTLLMAVGTAKIFSCYIVGRIYIHNTPGFLMDACICQRSVTTTMGAVKLRMEQVAWHPKKETMSKVSVRLVQDSSGQTWLGWIIP